jgi:hypothetical protein
MSAKRKFLQGLDGSEGLEGIERRLAETDSLPQGTPDEIAWRAGVFRLWQATRAMMTEADPASDFPPQTQRFFAREDDPTTLGGKVYRREGFPIRTELEFVAWRQVAHLVHAIIAAHALLAVDEKYREKNAANLRAFAVELAYLLEAIGHDDFA